MPDNIIIDDKINELYDECKAIVENPKRQARVEQWKKEQAFYFNAQWEEDESSDLEATGQVDVVLNTIRRATRTLLSQMVSDSPTAKFMARDVIPSSKEEAQALQERLNTLESLQGLWDHCWYISQGGIILRRAVQFQLMCGLGWIQVRKDPRADYYRGEITFVDHLPWEVIVPLSASKMDFSDANRIYLRTVITVPEAIRRLGEEYHDVIMRNAGLSTDVNDFDQTMLAPDKTDIYSSKLHDDNESGNQEINSIVEWIECEEKIRKDAMLYKIVTTQGNVFTQVYAGDQDGEKLIRDALQTKNGLQYSRDYKILSQKIDIDRIKRTTFLGRDVKVAEEELSTDKFTNVPVINEDTYNPLSYGEIFFVAPMQKLLNKVFSLAVLHLQSSGSGDRLVGFKGAFGETPQEIEAFQRLYSDPRSATELSIEYNEGANINNLIAKFQATPLQPAAVQLIQLVTGWIDRVYGVNPLSWGDPTNAPRTSSATMNLLNRGDVNSKLPIMNMQFALQQLGERWLDLAVDHYQFSKSMSVPDHNGIMKQYNINYPENGQTINALENIRTNIFITSGASLMIDRYSMLMLFKELIPLNPIFSKLFLLYSDIPEKADIIQEIDHSAQLEQQLAQLAPQLEELQKAVESKDNQLQSAVMKQNLMRINSTLKQVETKFRERLKTDAMRADFEHKMQLEREKNQASESKSE